MAKVDAYGWHASGSFDQQGMNGDLEMGMGVASMQPGESVAMPQDSLLDAVDVASAWDIACQDDMHLAPSQKWQTKTLATISQGPARCPFKLNSTRPIKGDMRARTAGSPPPQPSSNGSTRSTGVGNRSGSDSDRCVARTVRINMMSTGAAGQAHEGILMCARPAALVPVPAQGIQIPDRMEPTEPRLGSGYHAGMQVDRAPELSQAELACALAHEAQAVAQQAAARSSSAEARVGAVEQSTQEITRSANQMVQEARAALIPLNALKEDGFPRFQAEVQKEITQVQDRIQKVEGGVHKLMSESVPAMREEYSQMFATAVSEACKAQPAVQELIDKMGRLEQAQMQSAAEMKRVSDQMGRLEQSQRRQASDMQTVIDSGVEVSNATRQAQAEATACRKLIVQLEGKVRTLEVKLEAGQLQGSSAAPEVNEAVSRRIQFFETELQRMAGALTEKDERFEAMVSRNAQEIARLNQAMRQMQPPQTEPQDRPEVDNLVRQLAEFGVWRREIQDTVQNFLESRAIQDQDWGEWGIQIQDQLAALQRQADAASASIAGRTNESNKQEARHINNNAEQPMPWCVGSPTATLPKGGGTSTQPRWKMNRWLSPGRGGLVCLGPFHPSNGGMGPKTHGDPTMAWMQAPR